MLDCAAFLGVDLGSWGAVLTGLGSLMLLGMAVSGTQNVFEGVTFEGTLVGPRARLKAGISVAGAVLVAAGALLLLVASSDVGALAVIVSLAAAASIAYAAMALYLRAHMRLVAKAGNGSERSFLWCLLNPLWRPPSHSDGSQEPSE